MFSQLSKQRAAENEAQPSFGSDASSQQAPAHEVAKLKGLHQQNSDLFGWISIENTPINYPVMYTPENPEFYLRHSFDRKSSISGTPFVGAGYAAGAINTIIYGHKMKNDTMFSTLLDYADPAYHQAHRFIQFDTLLQEESYEIFAAFYSKVYSAEESEGFRYYNGYALQTEAQFNEYVAKCKEEALYDTGVTPSYGDRLITLSTCSYHVEDGRFVVVARTTTQQPKA